MTLNLAAKRSSKVAERWVCSTCRCRELKKSRLSFSTHTGLQPRRTGRYNGPSNQDYKRFNHKLSSTTTRSKSARTRDPKLPSGPARTRFAPSPTGYLHIGGLRTALFSYLLAKRTGGQFLLRIEDTDQKRLVADAEAKLVEDLQWAGLEWDEGPGVGGPYGPYRQSERTEIYHQYAKQLLENGSAYRCFCSPQSAGGAQTAYVTSGCYQSCASLSPDESQERAEDKKEAFTVRLHVPPDAHKRVYPDLVYGRIQRLKRSPASPTSEDGDAGIESSDTILMKSDGTPTYHFANVVDDHLMNITHVIRGVEWSASTPLHYDIYSAFNWTPPQFAHVGLLVDQSQAKLSKRNQDMALDVASMRDVQGVLPETLVNFLALLGWSNPTKNDVMDMQSLVENFDLKFTKGNAMVRTEKLWYLQRKQVSAHRKHALENNTPAKLQPIIDRIKPIVVFKYQATLPPWLTKDPDASGLSFSDKLSTYILAVLLQDHGKYETASQWVERNRYFFAWTRPPTTPYSAYERFFGNTHEQEQMRAEEMRQLTHLAQCYGAELSKHRFGEFIPDAPMSVPECDFLIPKPEPGVALGPNHLLNNTDLCAQWMHDTRREAAIGYGTEFRGWPGMDYPLIRFLREKLAMGMPGPGIDTVMAVLGPKECARRLRIALDEEEAESSERGAV